MNSLYDLRAQLAQIKSRLAELIETLPDAADGVQLLPGSTKCGVVSFSTIAANQGILSPSYYLTSEIKQEMLTRIQAGSIDSVINLVEGILQTGKLALPGRRGGHNLPPVFVNKLREIWGSK